MEIWKQVLSQGIIHKTHIMKLFGKILAMTDGAGNVLETYTHGADLSGHVGGGAGGIGGILASTQAGGPAYYHYDFNGNIVNVSSSNQTQLARYTYSPFGEVLLHDGPFHSRYQFSTKEFDASTGLNYYGYRFYHPELGRWASSDPIEDVGIRFYSLNGLWIPPNPVGIIEGMNLFAFVRNSPFNSIDVLGLACGSGWLGDLLVPDNPGGFPFGPSCEKHDDCYGDGGCKAGKSKEQCDQEFYNSMMQVCMSQPISEYYICHGDRLCWRNPKADCERMAKTYRDAVVDKGQKAFDKARKCCKK